MNHVLLSIRSNLVNLIISGKKTVELRTTNLRIKPGQTVWVYSKSPKAVIEVVAEVREVHRLRPTAIWSRFHSATGLQKKEFDEFVDGRELLTAIEFGNVRKLKSPMTLEDLRAIKVKFQPPQLVHYLTETDPLRIELKNRRLVN